ncbi:helix-turn-helix domain-containing protein [Mesorhizobium sp. CN2-181]|uniref:helix-turn-helix domain-containing protein n=1 Tax=Mesorhizobium yinganensis TaxID=3157707 RepID=UPI0032B84D76
MLLENLSREQLIEHIDDLQSQVDNLTEAMAFDDIPQLQMAFGLSTLEAKLLNLLSDGRTRNRDQILGALYYDKMRTPPDPKTVEVYAHRVRQKTARFGIQITTTYGAGYTLSDPRGCISEARAGKQITDVSGILVPLKTRTKNAIYGENQKLMMDFLHERADLIGQASFTSREAKEVTKINRNMWDLLDQLTNCGAIKVLIRPTKGGYQNTNWHVQLL